MRWSLPRSGGWPAAALLGVVAGIVVAALVDADRSAREATPTMGVAAATNSPAGSPAATDVPAMVSIESFDALPMNSVLGADWIVSGGDGASIVALPTSVDRSVRVRSSDKGEAATACRAVDATAAERIGFDLLVGRPPRSATPVVTVNSGERDLLILNVDPSGRSRRVAAGDRGELPQIRSVPDSPTVGLASKSRSMGRVA